MAFMSRNYEALQGIAAEFNKTAVRIVTIMQQPVPFVYFHLLKLMMVMVNVLVAYEMVDIFESWVASMVIFSVVAAMLLGLQEIAGAMADPFGVDDTDFDTHKLCYDAYKNAVAYLRVKQPTDPEAGIGDDEPRVNPVANAQRPCHSPSRAQSATNDTNDASSSAGASLMLSQASACPAPQTSSAVSPPQAKAWSLVTKRGGGGARV